MNIQDKLALSPLLSLLPLNPADVTEKKFRAGQIISDRPGGVPSVYIAGDEMNSKLSGYLSVLYDQNPKAVGGNLPGDDFYYNK